MGVMDWPEFPPWRPNRDAVNAPRAADLPESATDPALRARPLAEDGAERLRAHEVDEAPSPGHTP